MLTGCNKSIKQEDFVIELQKAKASVTEKADDIKNVKISQKNGNEFDYKEGEFYTHKYVDGLILIIPTYATVSTWKDGDKYYHAEDYNFFKTDVPTKEISEEQFNAYLAAGKATVLSELLAPLEKAEALMDSSLYPEDHQPKNSYTKTYKGEYKMSSKEQYKISSEDEEYKTRTITIFLKNELPMKYVTKTDSETSISYQFGKAEAQIPTFSSSEQE